MLNIKYFKNKELAFKNTAANNIKAQWIDIKKTKSHDESVKAYTQICTQYGVNNKWILMVNPQEESFEKLAPTTLNQKNILRVHTNQGRINIDNIAKALLKGNCSAIVLCDLYFTANEMNQLQACAGIGETKCIIISKNEILH